MGRRREIDIKIYTYYFSDFMISIKNFDPNKITVGKKSSKNTRIYYIGYMTP